MKLKNIIKPNKILIVLTAESQILNEATRRAVGNYTARRDQPHVPTDQYHAHVDLPKGYQVAWNTDGTGHHPGKFPATIPHDAKLAAAKVLGLDVGILETFVWHDDLLNEDVYIIQVKSERGTGEKGMPRDWL